MKFMLSLMALTAVSFAHAQNVRVTKVSGKKAIVVRESGPPLKVGMLLSAGGDELSDADLEGGSRRATSRPAGARDNTIGGSVTLGSSTRSAAGAKSKETGIDLSLFYGWNKKQMEYGPRFNLSYYSASSSGSPASSVTQFGVGGFFDYNFSPNVPGAEMIYAAGATLDYLKDSQKFSGSSSSTSTLQLFVGPAIKWFPLANSVAVRADAGLDYSRVSVTGGTVTTTGFLARAGLQVYF